MKTFRASVICVATFCKTLQRRNLHCIYFNLQFKIQIINNIYLKKDGLIDVCSSLNENEKEEARQKRLRETKLKKATFETIFHILIMVTINLTLFSNLDKRSFIYKTNLQNVFLNQKFQDVKLF